MNTIKDKSKKYFSRLKNILVIAVGIIIFTAGAYNTIESKVEQHSYKRRVQINSLNDKSRELQVQTDAALHTIEEARVIVEANKKANRQFTIKKYKAKMGILMSEDQVADLEPAIETPDTEEPETKVSTDVQDS